MVDVKLQTVNQRTADVSEISNLKLKIKRLSGR
jgi:hypothetical protein